MPIKHVQPRAMRAKIGTLARQPRMEHRWGNRLLVDLPVLLRRRGQRTAEGRLIEASLSGGLVRTELKLRDLSPIDLIIEGETVAASVVRHTAEGAAGIEWLEHAPQCVMAMLRSPERIRIAAELTEEWPVQT